MQEVLGVDLPQSNPKTLALSVARQQKHLLQLSARTLHFSIGGRNSQRTYISLNTCKKKICVLELKKMHPFEGEI